MDLTPTPDQERFRAECRSWLTENLPWEYGVGLPPLFEDLAEEVEFLRRWIRRLGAVVLALVGVVNVPIIKFSVDWWNTLHQPASVTRLDAPAIDPSMLTPLLVMALAFMFYFITMLLVRMRADLNAARARALRLSAAA